MHMLYIYMCTMCIYLHKHVCIFTHVRSIHVMLHLNMFQSVSYILIFCRYITYQIYINIYALIHIYIAYMYEYMHIYHEFSFQTVLYIFFFYTDIPLTEHVWLYIYILMYIMSLFLCIHMYIQIRFSCGTVWIFRFTQSGLSNYY